MEPYHNPAISSTPSGWPAVGTFQGAPVGRSEGGSLGILTKSVNPPPSEQLRRIERWALQAAAREILQKEKRLSSCFRSVLPLKDSVDIWKTEKERFYYGGLIRCGSVWQCPICANIITEKKRCELTAAFERNHQQGGSELLLTLTAPHYLGQSLHWFLESISDARKKMLNRKPWKRLVASLNVKGTIRGLEVTHSFINGWHPHFHVLLILSGTVSPGSLPQLEESIYFMWRDACNTAGLPEPSRAHGVSLEDGTMAAQYVGKWGLEHELAKSHVKKGREGHYTPFDFLRLHLAGDPRYADLFREYAKEFKGKRQLFWSEGLRDRLGVGKEKTDEELVEAQDETDTIFAKLPLSCWRVVLSQKKRGELLEVCSQGQEALFDYVVSLMEKEGIKCEG